MHSWRVLLLPYLDQRQLYEQYDFSKPWDSPGNLQLAARRPRTYLLHGVDDDGGIATNYLAVVGEGTPWPAGRMMTHEMMEETAGRTIRVVENVGSGILWTEPRDLDFSTMPMTLKDYPADGISSWLQPPAVAMVDGSTVTLSMELTEDEVRNMLLIDSDQELPGGAQEIEDGRDRPIKE
ncbi:hypothetical protein Fuma_00639 [Fuerstiella marisgermanici]|uniref:DUF1559 domain-containing protein n=2 Tax=Fuerstiella marisgermanici TaxID=1891926 RepID=A0A1P8WAJ6_9PLAN|nr:hypothetical protein Fuma_00639 [Fuerstiella marisgermanici]